MYNNTHTGLMVRSVESYKIKSSIIFMVLKITGRYTGNSYERKYYKVKYHSGEELVFVTTNEPNKNHLQKHLDDEYTLIVDFEHLVDEIEKSGTVDLLIGPPFNAPPKYIYYDILMIHNELKSKFLNHLLYNISAFTEMDFKKNEVEQISKWLKCLHN